VLFGCSGYLEGSIDGPNPRLQRNSKVPAATSLNESENTALTYT
jgi:hypothetical protein